MLIVMNQTRRISPDGFSNSYCEAEKAYDLPQTAAAYAINQGWGKRADTLFAELKTAAEQAVSDAFAIHPMPFDSGNRWRFIRLGALVPILEALKPFATDRQALSMARQGMIEQNLVGNESGMLDWLEAYLSVFRKEIDRRMS